MKALALLSGGLDSTLAVKLIQEQGLDVMAVNFTSPFSLYGKGECSVAELARQLGVPLKVIEVILRLLIDTVYATLLRL